jgi:hypothetical protein
MAAHRLVEQRPGPPPTGSFQVEDIPHWDLPVGDLRELEWMVDGSKLSTGMHL